MSQMRNIISLETGAAILKIQDGKWKSLCPKDIMGRHEGFIEERLKFVLVECEL